VQYELVARDVKHEVNSTEMSVFIWKTATAAGCEFQLMLLLPSLKFNQQREKNEDSGGEHFYFINLNLY